MSGRETTRPNEPSPFEELARATDERLTIVEDMIGSHNSSVRELLHSMNRLEMILGEAVELMKGEREQRVELTNRVQKLESRLSNGG